MILAVMDNGPIATAIREAIEEQPEAVRSVRHGFSGELFMAALGCRALVCAAAGSMLEGQLAPRPSAGRMRAVVRAARAPGVKLVVAVVPSGEAYEEEELVLKGDHIPFVIVRSAPLIEELEAARLPLASCDRIAVTTAALLAATVRRALDEPSWRGQTIEVPTVTLAAAQAARETRARKLTTQPTSVTPKDELLGHLGLPAPAAYACSRRPLPRAA